MPAFPAGLKEPSNKYLISESIHNMTPYSRFYKWELLILLFFAYFFHQADRAIFGVVAGDIQTDLGLSDTQIGLTAFVLFFTLALMVPIAGFVGDRFSRK